MVCIYCSSLTSVVNSRPQRRANRIWRRRRCLACGSIFTTQEEIELSGSIRVVFPDGRLVPFNRDRLFLALFDSLKHRPSGLEDAAAIAGTVINLLRPTIKNGVIAQADIIKKCCEVLTRFDKTAATVYAAYHPARL